MELFPFQREGLQDIRRFDGVCLVAYDMGLGKTPMSLRWLAGAVDALPALIVTPASVKEQWRRQVTQWSPQFSVTVGAGRTPPQDISTDLLIINWDLLHHWRRRLQEWQPRSVVFDEIHYAANARAKRTRAAFVVSQCCQYRLGLSGTPMVNKPAELFMPLQLLLPELFPSWPRYAARYCAPRMTPWGMDYGGAAHLDELHQTLLQRVMIRRRKEEVLTQLPAKSRVVVPLELSHPREYTRARNDFLRWLRELDPRKADRAARAEALTRIGYLKRLAAKLKCAAAQQWLREWFETTDEQLVVFAVHREMLNALERTATVPLSRIDGQNTSGQRDRAVQAFRSGQSRLFLGQIRAAGVGLDGLQCARACAFAEMDWRPADHTQAEDRLHRIGQQDAVLVYYLVAMGTIEEQLCKIIQRKQAIVGAVLDGSTTQGETFSVFDQLTRALLT